MKILNLAIKDFFTFKFLKFTLIPLIFSLLFMIVLNILGFSLLLDYFNSLFQVDTDSFLAWFYSLHFIKIFTILTAFLFSGFTVIFTSVFLALFITSFLTPLIVKEINAKYYQQESKSISCFHIFFEIFKIFLKFIGLFLLCTLALFLPFINFFAYYLAFYYLFHKLLILDVTSSALNEKNFIAMRTKPLPFEFRFSTLCFYLLSSIPFLGLFLQVFFVIFLTHLTYQKILKLKIKT